MLEFSSLAVWAQGDSIGELGVHLHFLAGFAGTMIVAGWLAYQRMLRVERKL